MNYKIKLLSVLLVFNLIGLLYAEYSVQNAFPSLSFTDPVGIYHAGDSSDRLFVLEQTGTIKVFNNNSSIQNADVFLDLTSIVDQDGGYTEEGLLGLAFHPNYIENGYFYVNYTSHNPRRNVIARYSVSEDSPTQGNPESALIILEVNQPYTNHNGGQMGFGPDGYLYIIFGDGGSSGDPLGHGQNLSTLLGSLIRIDIDNPSDGLNYGIPSDNPFIAPLAARDEIYAYGLRNMWRFSWDPVTGLLWGSDVGQYNWEEINIIYPGLNYGWNTMEGNHCYPAGSNCNSEGFEPPAWEYPLYVNGVCSITGGFVYRGSNMPSIYGKYIYGDWCTGDIWALNSVDNQNYLNEDLIRTGINITSFGLDENNELYFCGNQRIYKLSSNEGDLNDDGNLNVLDVILLVNLILTQQFNAISDFNNDEILNVLDVISLINIILE